MTGIAQKAPDFKLFDSDKKEHSLYDYRGHTVLLLFFPLAFTSTCTKELCSVRDDIGKYNQFQVQIFGISVDSLYTLARYKEEQQLNFPLLSDFNKEVSSRYGCLYQSFSFGMKGVSKRAAFIIDRENIIQYIEVLENAGEIPDFSQIKTVLQKLAEDQQVMNI